MARRKKHEDHVNTEAWAIPYGDLITLLLAFFVVMYAVSSVNEGKYRILSDSLSAAFRGAPKTLSPIQVGDKQSGAKGGEAMLTGGPPTALMKLKDARPVPEANLPPPLGKAAGPGGGQGPGSRSYGSLGKMAGAVKEAMQGLIQEGAVRIREQPLWLEIEIKADILFASGDARLSPQAVPVIARLGGILQPFPNPIRVEGHTDNRPIRTAVFPSNWELSAARAANVVQAFTSAGVDPLRMEIIGLGEHHPIAANDTDAGRNRNRRVLVVILQEAGAEGGYASERRGAPQRPPVEAAADAAGKPD